MHGGVEIVCFREILLFFVFVFFKCVFFDVWSCVLRVFCVFLDVVFMTKKGFGSKRDGRVLSKPNISVRSPLVFHVRISFQTNEVSVDHVLHGTVFSVLFSWLFVDS